MLGPVQQHSYITICPRSWHLSKPELHKLNYLGSLDRGVQKKTLYYSVFVPQKEEETLAMPWTTADMWTVNQQYHCEQEKYHR